MGAYGGRRLEQNGRPEGLDDLRICTPVSKPVNEAGAIKRVRALGVGVRLDQEGQSP
jgi:hypothetical protein